MTTVVRYKKGLRSAPSHWEKEKKKVMAMIPQFGLPKVFVTLSAAVSRWNELLVVLSNIVDSKIITEDEPKNINMTEKFRLIRSAPVTCSRYFDHRIKQPFKFENIIGGWSFSTQFPHISMGCTG